MNYPFLIFCLLTILAFSRFVFIPNKLRMSKAIVFLSILLFVGGENKANAFGEFNKNSSLGVSCVDKKGVNNSYKDKYQIAECLKANGRYKEAIKYYYDVLKYKKKQRPEIKDYFLYFQISDCLESTGQIQEALNLTNQALDTYKAEYGDNDRIYIQIITILKLIHLAKLITNI